MFYTGTSEHVDTKSDAKQKQSNQKVVKKVEKAQPKLLHDEKQVLTDAIKIPSKAVIGQKNALQLLLKTADDVKLLIDDLSVLEEVDEERIAMIGVSMGGFITYRAIVVDDRIKVGVPIISSPYWEDIPGDVTVRKTSETELLALYEEFQPSKHMELFYPTALLIQVGEIDQRYNLNKVKKYYEDLTYYYLDSPNMIKLIVYPDTKHEFKHVMWEQALQWMRDFL